MWKSYQNKWIILLFLLPAILLFVGVLVGPILLSGYYSLFDMKAYGPRVFVGLKNYKELFSSPAIGFGKAVCNSLILAGLSVLIQLPLALLIALVMGKGMRGERTYMSINFVPVLISTVVIGQLFLKIYNPDYGLLNMLLGKLFALLGLDNTETFRQISEFLGLKGKNSFIWLGEKKLALGSAFLPMLWQYVGYHMLLMYAGIKSVPTDLREAAMMDGASNGRVNRHIVLPYIKPILKVSVIFSVTGSLKSYDLIYVLTNGGPQHATEVPSTLMINMLFQRNRYGMGSAIAVMLILLCFGFALLIGALFREEK